MNTLKTPLYQETFDLSPEFQDSIEVGNRVDWTFSVLMGRFASKQIPLACDADGVLNTNVSSAALTKLLAILDGSDVSTGALTYGSQGTARYTYMVNNNTLYTSQRLISTNDVVSLADYFDTVEANEPLYYGGDSIASLLSDIYTLLYDVWSTGNNASQLRTAVIA